MVYVVVVVIVVVVVVVVVGSGAGPGKRLQRLAPFATWVNGKTSALYGVYAIRR